MSDIVEQLSELSQRISEWLPRDERLARIWEDYHIPGDLLTDARDEILRLRARVAELERQPPGIVSAGCQCPPGANAQCENHWCPRKTTSFRVTCGAAP